MSGLGQKQPFAVDQPMSALPPNSNIDCVFRHVCFGPKADIAVFLIRQLDRLVGASNKRWLLGRLLQ
jgi:hypothetical protein